MLITARRRFQAANARRRANAGRDRIAAWPPNTSTTYNSPARHGTQNVFLLTSLQVCAGQKGEGWGGREGGRVSRRGGSTRGSGPPSPLTHRK